MKNEQLSTILGHNHYVINKNLEGITQKESMICTSAGENKINWLLGHIVASRDTLLDQLGIDPAMNDETYSIYERTTEKFNNDNASDISTLLSLYNSSQKNIIKALESYEVKDANDLNQLCAMIFHETYHAGQLGMKRRLIGKEVLK